MNKNNIQSGNVNTYNKLYIAYGSNLNLPQMERRCPFARVVGTSEIKDYELVFRGSKTGSYATIEPCEGAVVPVLLWKITSQDERCLDIYEGFPSFYKKETMTLPLNGKDINAMVYIMPSTHELGMPSQSYVHTIEYGYETAGFDPQILYDAIDKTEFRIAEQKMTQADVQEIENKPEVEQQNLFGFKWC